MIRKVGFVVACAGAAATAIIAAGIDAMSRLWRGADVDWSAPELDDPLADWHYADHPSYPCDPLLSEKDWRP